MNILFLVPPNLANLNVLRDSVYGCWCKGNRMGGATAPPHPLLLMATCVRDAGHNVCVVDALIDPVGKQKLQSKIAEIDAVVVQTSVMAFLDDCEVLLWLKEQNPDVKTIVCGSMPTFLPEKTLKHDAVDLIVQGEAEEVLVELFRRIEGRERFNGLVGLGYKEGGKSIITGKASPIENLDLLPHADWSLLDHGQTYFNPIIKRHPYVTELTTRGCFAKCVFCMAPQFYGGKIRGHSADYVLEALEKYQQQGIKEIYFRDEMFTSLKKRNLVIWETMIKKKIDLAWICSSRVNAIDESDIKLMKKAGCHWIKFGVESGSQKILDNMKKDISLDEVRETFALCRKHGIHTHAHFMIGCVGESWETINETNKFAREIRPTTATFGMLNVYPGTTLWDRLKEDCPNLEDGFSLRLQNLHSQSFLTDKLTELSAEELKAAVKIVHRKFFLRPGYLVSHLQRMRSWQDISALFQAGRKIIDYTLKGND